jgi:hypothetical protein
MQNVFNKATESGDSLPRRSFPKIQKFSLLCKIELISRRRRTRGKKDNYHTHVSSIQVLWVEDWKHGLINYKDNKPSMSSLLVFNRV